ncbi:MAG: hypothetical protein AAGC70_11600 [Pseudomonadota bacterium]
MTNFRTSAFNAIRAHVQHAGSKVLGLITIAAISVSVLSGTAQAGANYGVFCLENTTNAKIRFSVRIGRNGTWKSHVVYPGDRQMFWHAYDYEDEYSSPETWVRFDADIRSGRRQLKRYMVTRNGVSRRTCRGAKNYRFRADWNNRRFIKLVEL